MTSVITGWGQALPDKILSNSDLEARLDTSDTWIRERTGIAERRLGGSTIGLAIEAGAAALDRAGVTGAEVDHVVLATSTPDETMPATAVHVHHALGIRGGAMDLNAACSGFVYGLATVNGLIAAGARRVLLIGSETMSRIIDWEDRNTAVLFGDGAGAVVMEAATPPAGVLAWDLGTDGSGRHLLRADLGGYITMEGREVFRRAVRGIVDTVERSMAAAGVTAADIDCVIPHQANIRIVEAACERFGVPMEKTVNVLDRTGNTSAASIPIALTDALDRGRIHDGDLVLFVGFGAGMSWGSVLMRWDGRS
jgi:3-oxoacyl-[acyl-carrier-protein] synthase-3